MGQRSRTSEPGVTRYRGKQGTSYHVRVSYRDPATGERQYVYDSFPTLALARDFRRKTLHELRSGVYQEPCMEPVSAVMQHWLETARLAPNSKRSYEVKIRTAINPAIGMIPLSRLDGRMIQDLYNQPRGDSASVQVQAALNGALELALREGLIQRNPAAGLRVPRTDGPAPEPPVWTVDELQTFLDATTGHNLCDLYHVAAHTGLRLSELIALRWADVSLDLARLFVAHAKTAAGVRRVALDAATIERLRAHQSEQQQRRAWLGSQWQEHGRVFERGTGQPVSPRTVEAHMARTVARLGLPPLTPHSLRHFHSASLLRAGVPLNVVQRRLGHANASTTATIYGRWTADDEREAAEVIGQLLDCRDVNGTKAPEPLRKTASE